MCVFVCVCVSVCLCVHRHVTAWSVCIFLYSSDMSETTTNCTSIEYAFACLCELVYLYSHVLE